MDEYGIHHIESIKKTKYRARIRRSKMHFWDLVFYLKDYEGVKNMSYDEFQEAYTAYEMFSEEIENETKGGS